MKCPNCGANNEGVVDSRCYHDKVWRRRKCFSCGKKFTTYEVYSPDGKSLPLNSFRAASEEYARFRYGLKGTDKEKA